MRTDPERENILSIRDDDKHTKYRAKLAPRYTGKDVEHLEPRIDRNTLDLVNLPDKTYITKAQYFTLDIISDVSFGQAFGFVASDSDMYEYIAALEAQIPNMVMSSIYP